MSTTLHDLKGGVSNCCGAPIYLDYGICSECKDHCDEIQKCVGCDETENLEYCQGTMCKNCYTAENEEPNLAEE